MDLTRLEDLSDSIVQDFIHMRKLEEEMRDTNGIHSFYFILFCVFKYPTFFDNYRIHQQSSVVLQHLQHVLPVRFGNVASSLFASILQGKEIDRVNANTKRKQRVRGKNENIVE